MFLFFFVVYVGAVHFERITKNRTSGHLGRMMTLRPRLVLVLLAVAVAAAQQGTNYFPNPSFENTTATRWHFGGDAHASGRYAAGVAHTGAYSMLLNDTVGGNKLYAYSDYVDVPAGKVYYLSVWLRTDGRAHNAQVGLQFVNSTSQTYLASYLPCPVNNTWTRCVFNTSHQQTNAGKNKNLVKLRVQLFPELCGFDHASFVYFDDGYVWAEDKFYTETHTSVPTPPAGQHPRVYLTSSALSTLRSMRSNAAYSSLWRDITSAAASGSPLQLAFLGMVTANASICQRAIATMLTQLTAEDDGRVFDSAFHFGACVYDWCYAQLTAAQKNSYIAQFKRIADLETPYYPIDRSSMTVVGHPQEGWLLTGQLPAGLAFYDEDSAMYNGAASFFFDGYVPPRLFHYAAHWHHQGDSYYARFIHDSQAAWLFYALFSKMHVLGDDMQYVPYQTIYSVRPDGSGLRAGDTWDDCDTSSYKRYCALIQAAMYNNGILYNISRDYEYAKWGRMTGYFSVFQMLILSQATIAHNTCVA
eukprot:TRINITY_DN1527_c0_g2_i2.p1 TRINITY_DN1527_c0_g2~~TRINITY_DN1527_c0_g2_i2.p1  ORF type:complete len:529 (+),score=113.09 TRINITY_DN1527_c0_g2_i2:96-1682(+)